MKPVNRDCPLCGKALIRQSAQDAGGSNPDIYCPEEITLPEDKRVVNHYREHGDLMETRIYLHPYRIVTKDGQSKLGKRDRYKTKAGVATKKGSLYFKTLIKCPEIHPDTEEKLLNRIKLLLLLS